MRVDFSIANWSAWAPGLPTQDAWRAWALAPPVAPRGTDLPPLTEVPAMARRRIEKLGRLAFQVAAWCEGDARGLPLVFASRHGEPGRGVELLTMLAKGEVLSPTSFALSVHNAIGAQYSIIRQDPANLTAVSNGIFTLEAGLIEAATLLTESPEVMLVVYDSSPPPLYAHFWDEPSADFAFAWRLTGGTDFSLESTQPAASEPLELDLPRALSVLRFVLGAEPSLEWADQAAGWRWSRGG